MDNSSYEEKALSIEAEETEVLKSLLQKQNKQLFYARISSIAVLVMAAIVFVACVVVIPKVIVTINQVNELIAVTNDTIKDVDATLETFDAMSAEITAAASGINGLVEDNSQILTDSVNKMNSIDFEGLNSAIKDLQDVVQPMANFFNKFR